MILATEHPVILIDAFSQIFRAYYAMRKLTDSHGRPNNAVFVFFKILLSIEKKFPDTKFGAMLFDSGKVDFRLAIVPEYKANRPPMPEELSRQLPIIREIGAAFGWQLISQQNYEADDLIAGFTLLAAPCSVKIVSSDKDLSQLISEKVHILAPSTKSIGFEERGIDFVINKFNVTPELIPDYLAIVGDSADNIAGIEGIGPKGAAELLNKFGPIESWVNNIALLNNTRFFDKINGKAERLMNNLSLTRLRTALPDDLCKVEKVLTKSVVDWDKLLEICADRELRSISSEITNLSGHTPLPYLQSNSNDDDLFAFCQSQNGNNIESKNESKKKENPKEYEQGTLF